MLMLVLRAVGMNQLMTASIIDKILKPLTIREVIVMVSHKEVKGKRVDSHILRSILRVMMKGAMVLQLMVMTM